ncbi:glycolate oxidase [Dactylonectria estremocensis]|uniref:D-lactate dehydrogenase (cytochrome) n=1 Tax=Dactylonectria estremocensis TaxID=1079267 RepID=A0A9P9IPK1_9HYPO|nr:glycolate oxidase [Dactylonectria estremocensis]
MMLRSLKPQSLRAGQRRITQLSSATKPMRERGSAVRLYSVQPSVRSNAPQRLAGFGAILCLVFAAGVAIGRGRVDRPKSTGLPRVCYADRKGMLVAASEIHAALGEDAVSYDEDDIETHGYSDWSSCNSLGRGVAIVYPKSTEEVSTAAAICNKHNVPIVPFGAGSSIEGNFASPYSGIVIDLTYMNKIMAFHPDDMDVVVQPGVNWMDLNKMIQHENLFLPLDPSPTATVGGMVSTNCSGTNAFRYGTMKDWVINLTIVLADGQIIKTRRRPRKTSAGYNLTSLFVGAEGTLGIVTEVTLKLAVVPKETGVAVVSFSSVADAASAASKLIRSGISLAAIELMDDVQMRIINRHGSEAVRKISWDENPSLFLKFSGPTKDGVDADVSQVRAIIESNNPRKYFFAKNKEEESSLWAARKEALWTMTSLKPEGHTIWSTDVAVPISRLAEIVDISKNEGEQLGVFASIVGHVGDGNFHEAIMYDAKDPALHAAVGKAIHNMMDRALEMEGTVSGEHAIGMGKMHCLVNELGADTIHTMKLLKQALDPKWIMNPGKVFTVPEDSNVNPAPNQTG